MLILAFSLWPSFSAKWNRFRRNRWICGPFLSFIFQESWGRGLCPLRWRRTLSRDHHAPVATQVPWGLVEGQGQQTFQEGKDSRSVFFLHTVRFLCRSPEKSLSMRPLGQAQRPHLWRAQRKSRKLQGFQHYQRTDHPRPAQRQILGACQGSRRKAVVPTDCRFILTGRCTGIWRSHILDIGV